MKTTLLRAMQTNDSLTENGAVTNSTSLNACVDLFFTIGAMRGQDKQRLINSFTKAFAEDSLTAMKLLFWVRDVKYGSGERQIFKDIISYMADNHSEVIAKNIHLIPEFGRWDDVLSLFGTSLQANALSLISKHIEDKNSLIFKWLPRPNATNNEARSQANIIRKHLGMSPKEYRKLLVNNSNTVEQLMCSNKWGEIQYAKLPSKAMSDLMKTFSRHDNDRFGAYLKALEKGEVKINAGAVYPYDIIKNLKNGVSSGADLQWNALPNYMEGNQERIFPVVDVSSSMSTQVGDNPNLNVMDVAISLGLYICERNIGPYKDAFITFDSNPRLITVNGKLSERYSQMKSSPWGGSTNISATFDLILNKAVQSKVPESEMPTMVIIFSDMQFNQSDSYWNDSAHQMIERKYNKAGYVMPKIVYWNLQTRGDKNKPVHFDKNGTALVSGFSTALLTNLLAGKDMTPYSMMRNVIDSERYSSITV